MSKLFTALEMALLKVSNDLLLTLDSGDNVTFFWLAFNTGLALRLQLFTGSVLVLRCLLVFLILCPYFLWGPSGSILEPINLSLHLFPLNNNIKRYNIAFYFYTDDLQLYIPVKYQDSLQLLLDGLEDN